MLGKPLKLYILAIEESISCFGAQDAKGKFKRAICYLSQLLNDAKIRYTLVEKLCFSLHYACTKLEYYVLLKEVLVIHKVDIVKFLLNEPILQGRLMEWAIKLHTFTLNYVPLKAIKG